MIEVKADPGPWPSKSVKPAGSGSHGWYVHDTDAPIDRKYLNTDGVWRGCCSRGWFNTLAAAEAAAESERRKSPADRKYESPFTAQPTPARGEGENVTCEHDIIRTACPTCNIWASTHRPKEPAND